MPNAYVTDLTAFPNLLLTKHVGLLSGGRGVETLNTPKHHPPPGRHRRPLPTYFDLDAWWGTHGIH
jgi:hypothetical protein